MSLILIKYEIFPAGSPAMFPKFNCKSYFTLVDGEERVEFFKLWYLSLENFLVWLWNLTKLREQLQMLNLMIHVKAFFITACLSPNIIIQISRMHILTFSQVYIPQVVNRCHISLSFVQGLFVSFKSFILWTKMKQILFVC